MEDIELDISEGMQEPEADSDDDAPARKPFGIFSFIVLFVLLLILFLFLSNNGARNANQNAGPTEAYLSYQSLSNETHTGIRLARLDDFLAQHTDSTYTGAVRARRDALKQHEEKAWAKLTDAFYHAEADEEGKAIAIKAYTDIWTPLHRPTQLKALEQILPNDAVPNFKPMEKKSRFASGGNDRFLEGAPASRQTVFPQAIVRNTRPERVGPARIIEPRIRKKRSPTYPRSAKRRKIEADVVLELDIDDRGRVAQVRVRSVRANRYARDFAKAATRAARRTRFHPKTIGGRPVAKSGHIQKYAFRANR